MKLRPWIINALLLTVALATPPPRAEGQDLSAATRQVNDGDFEAALVTLDEVIHELKGSPERAKELARAYVYLGVAYIGLGQEALAKGKFRLALQQHRDLQLDPSEFPAKVIRVFAAAQQSEEAALRLQSEVKRSRGKGALVLLGLGGAAAAGVAASVITKERENNAPSASIRVSPEGQAVVRVTQVGFSATASDPDGDPLSFSWDFGDGGTASGAETTHVFRSSGSFGVTLTAADGLASTKASTTVTGRTLTGVWLLTAEGFLGVTGYRIDDESESGPRVTVLLRGNRVVTPSVNNSARLAHPRNIRTTYTLYVPNPPPQKFPMQCLFELEGEVDPALQTITGTLFCRNQSCCDGQPQQPVALIRQ